MEAAAERAAAQSAAIIEDAMAQAEEMRRKAAKETHSQVCIMIALSLSLSPSTSCVSIPYIETTRTPPCFCPLGQ